MTIGFFALTFLHISIEYNIGYSNEGFFFVNKAKPCASFLQHSAACVLQTVRIASLLSGFIGARLLTTHKLVASFFARKLKATFYVRRRVSWGTKITWSTNARKLKERKRAIRGLISGQFEPYVHCSSFKVYFIKPVVWLIDSQGFCLFWK